MPKRRRADSESSNSDGEGFESELNESDLEEMIVAGKLNREEVGTAHVNNVAGLHRALAELREDVPWVERLEVVSAEPITADSNDDLRLELAFYGQALAAVLAARGELERLGVPHRRPDDYFAEMIKSDEHMQKVKDRLVFEQKKITAVENRKKERLTAKYTKQVAIEKMKAKAADRKAQLDALSSWRKNKNGKRPDLSTEAELNAFLSNATGGAGADGGAAAGGRTGGSNRKAKDRKFGFGIGNKKMRKENTAASSHSTKGFSMGRNRSLPPGMQSRGGKGGAGGGFKGGKNAGGSRPGKQARQSMRGKGRR